MKTRLNRLPLPCATIVLACGLLLTAAVRAEDASFTNALAQAAQASQRGDLPAAARIYGEAAQSESNHPANLCSLARSYCDLMYLTNAPAAKRALLQRAWDCAQAAVKAGPADATAHATLAVCYAKRCAFTDIKGELADSRQFKLEAEKTITLDPKQDIAYYLLGRWNYAIANVGLLSRAYVRVIYGGLPKASNADAIKNFQQAIKLAPNRIIHHAGLAMVYAATGETKLELAELKKCHALEPVDREDADAQREAETRLASLRH